MSCPDALQCDTWLPHCQVKAPKCLKASVYVLGNAQLPVLQLINSIPQSDCGQESRALQLHMV